MKMQLVKNKILNRILSCIICSLLLIICFSIVKGRYFVIVKTYYWSGYIKQRFENRKGAIADYNKALRYDKEYPTAYISRGSAYLDLKEYQKAISDYNEAIQLIPNDPQSYAYRGRAYYEIDSIKKSLNDFNKAISLDNEFVYAYSNRALLRYTKIHDYKGACEDLKKAVALGDKEAKNYIKQGLCNE